jgi:hypothetical protein
MQPVQVRVTIYSSQGISDVLCIIMYNFYRCTAHLDIIKVLQLPTDALYTRLRKH